MKNRLKQFIFFMAAVVMIAACSDPKKNGNDNQAPSALHDEQTMEKTIRTMARMMRSTDSTAVRARLTVFFNGLLHDEEALLSAMKFSDKYLNTPDSPYQNGNDYINLLSALLEIDSIPSSVRALASERLHVASLNKVGAIANDFQFEMPDGSRRSLHAIESPLTLLIFYNPECSPCKKILAAIAANPRINAAIGQKRLTVVAIYAEGDHELWRSDLAGMPENWTVGYDRSEILDNDIYNLPAMPTLYLLDADKRVLLKDPTPRRLIKALQISHAAKRKS